METESPSERMERAYAAGDHQTARALARDVTRGGADESGEARARRVLRDTEPDPFLTLVGALGLGLLLYLVYNYVL